MENTTTPPTGNHQGGGCQMWHIEALDPAEIDAEALTEMYRARDEAYHAGEIAHIWAMAAAEADLGKPYAVGAWTYALNSLVDLSVGFSEDDDFDAALLYNDAAFAALCRLNDARRAWLWRLAEWLDDPTNTPYITPHGGPRYEATQLIAEALQTDDGHRAEVQAMCDRSWALGDIREMILDAWAAQDEPEPTPA